MTIEDVIFVAVLLGMEYLVVFQAVYAHKCGFLTVASMRESGYQYGLPFFGHGAMWGDALVIAPLCAFIVSRYGGQWGWFNVLIVTCSSGILTLGMHVLYAQGFSPSFHCRNGYLLSASGPHMVFMTIGLAVIFLFYWSTGGVSLSFALPVTVVLGVHVFTGGTQIPLSLMKVSWWQERSHGQWMPWVTVVCAWGALVFSCYKLVNRSGEYE